MQNFGYLTPYFIWANYNIDKKSNQVDDISMNYLSSLLLDVAGLDKTPYMHFLDDMRKEIPVINGHGFIDKNNIYHSFDEDTEYNDLINKYELLQYNNLFDTKHTINEFFSIKKSQ